MEEKKATKVSLSTFFLIIAIIAIIVMGIFIYKLYNDKTTEMQKSTELQSQVNSLNGTISELQKKIDNISNITKTSENSINTNNKSSNTKVTENNNNVEIKYDIEIKPSEVAELYKEWQSKGNDMNVFKEFNKKYIGKVVKVTGDVNYYGISNRDNYEFCINLVSDNFDRVYATCLTNEKELAIKEGQKITIVGTYMDDPNVMTLYNINIID